MFPTEQACASRPLTTRLQKSMLPVLTSNFPEFFSGEITARKGPSKRYFAGTRWG